MKKQRISDIILNGITGILSTFGIFVLVVLLYFIFSKGFKTLSFDLLVSDYYSKIYNTYLTEDINFGNYQDPNIKDAYFSKKWGIALKDTKNKENMNSVKIVYIDERSPLNNMKDTTTKEYTSLYPGLKIEKIFLSNDNGDFIMGLGKDKAESIINNMESGNVITDMVTSIEGGGIRGSLITTLYLIVLTLIIALPLGISAAIYLHEYSRPNKFTNILRSMIEMTSGIPSIIFGLVGAIVFIPFMNNVIGSDGGSIASGALTLTIILLPIIIRTTEEALKVIPQSYRNASLSLGASETQTTFKVVLPNAISGILAATILSIGRIIGESAALIYAVGTAIKDQVAINQKSTSLAVHIWSIMSGENPNYQLASAISIVILIIVLTLSVIVKILGRRLNRFEVK